jgi:hypothetical protein
MSTGAAVALVNRRLRGGLGFYLRYDARTLPAYLAWRMMREGLYAIGLEPAQARSNQELIAQGYRSRSPGETRRTSWSSACSRRAAIDAFAESLP